MEIDDIREKLDWLRQADPELWPFGTTVHRFRLLPPLSRAKLRSACQAYSIELPEDYVEFLLNLGNGGAGPGYGLERFGCVASKSLIPTAEPKGDIVKIHVKGGREVSRSELFDAKGQEVEWLDVSFFDTMAGLAGDGEYGPEAPSRPFLLDRPLDDEEDSIWETLSPADGVWTLAGYGCGIVANLVLNGPFRGQVWVFDPNASSYEPFAEQTYLHDENCPVVRDRDDDIVFTFGEWYEHWLDYAVLGVQADSEAATE
jgi:hypothetical protein